MGALLRGPPRAEGPVSPVRCKGNNCLHCRSSTERDRRQTPSRPGRRLSPALGPLGRCPLPWPAGLRLYPVQPCHFQKRHSIPEDRTLMNSISHLLGACCVRGSLTDAFPAGRGHFPVYNEQRGSQRPPSPGLTDQISPPSPAFPWTPPSLPPPQAAQPGTCGGLTAGCVRGCPTHSHSHPHPAAGTVSRAGKQPPPMAPPPLLPPLFFPFVICFQVQDTLPGSPPSPTAAPSLSPPGKISGPGASCQTLRARVPSPQPLVASWTSHSPLENLPGAGSRTLPPALSPKS